MAPGICVFFEEEEEEDNRERLKKTCLNYFRTLEDF